MSLNDGGWGHGGRAFPTRRSRVLAVPGAPNHLLALLL